MNSIQQISALNNEAVSLLASGATARALKTFKNALQVLNKNLTESNSIAIRNQSNASRSQKVVVVAPITLSSVQESDYYVYNRPYLFSLDDTTFDFQYYSAAIMFNMALTLHSRDRCTCDKAKKSALRLYEATLSILEDACGVSECMSIFIATLNNLSQIYHELCRYDEARGLLAMLLEIIGTPEYRSAFEQKDLEEFLQNGTLLSMSAAAPAA